jgi:hypothetical protein
MLTLNKSKQKKSGVIKLERESQGGKAYDPNVIGSATELTLNNLEHQGFENTGGQQMMCFGCWSSGLNKHCSLHESGKKIKASETMLLCRNWELDVMRRRYRSEEIQEIFMRKEASLRFNPKYQRFYTVTEQKHPIYRMQSQLLERYNARMCLFAKIKFWLLSLGDQYRQGTIHPSTEQNAKLMRIRRGLVNLMKIERYSTINRQFLPIAPITGYSWPERCGDIQFLYKYFEKKYSIKCIFYQQE